MEKHSRALTPTDVMQIHSTLAGARNLQWQLKCKATVRFNKNKTANRGFEK